MKFVIVKDKARDGGATHLYMVLDSPMMEIPKEMYDQVPPGESWPVHYDREAKEWVFMWDKPD